ncbi:MAG: CHAT domain-containing protein [Candidatus Aminicenantes bacterium]|nr:CHAT domain-containing protein [Candidatus Aminicenantes bacterium]
MENPAYANLLYPQPYGYEEIIEKLLNKETALLEYIIGEKYSFAFLATSKNLFLTRLPDSKFLIKLVNNYLNFLTLKETGEFKAKRGSKRLFNLLMGAFSEQFEKDIKKIIIVPDGNLNYLPFETLIREGGSDNQDMQEKGKNSRFLIQDYEISYIPSASSLINILERKAIKKRKKDLLVIANPKPGHPNKFVSFLNNLLKPLSANKNKSDNFIFNFPHLPHAHKEAKTIAKFFDTDKKLLLLKNEAEERRFKQLNLGDFKIIHFATHGVIDNENWWRSALILLPDKNLSEDGFLQPREIYDLKLNSDLVVLSACQTGKGKLEKGEGITGLAKAFLNTGSKSVISSLWNVNDKSTAQIMKCFYQYIIEGKSKAQALRLAKIKMINSKYSHPFHWAAFILMGDYGSSVEM